MIYLIDEKKQRQEKDYNWTRERFETYKDFISPIYSLDELQEKAREIFQEENIILYHESFLDKTDLNTKAFIKRDKLDEFSKKHNSYLVFFSGSKNSREITENIANIPVSVLYSNLEVFINNIIKKDINLKYLLFGRNPDVEEELSKKLQEALYKTSSESPAKLKGETLFIRPATYNIVNPIEEATQQNIFNNVSDEYFSEKIAQWLNEKIYNTIFIPLCFGSTLSDYNGLRLATHIRCTKTMNQTSRIIIYAFVGLDYIISDLYFNILKTKNVQLVDLSKNVFENICNEPYEELNTKEIPNEISKLKLEPPKNYSDSHSVANEWAIYRWAISIGAHDDKIETILKKVNHSLYFKYLQTIFPISYINNIGKESLKIDGIENAKVLYIDDEADKGWYEIFCTILVDINGLIDFEYISEEFKDKTQDEIISISLDRMAKQDSEIVILDFRLHENDFSEKDINQITGLKLLKEIKKINPGIQVIIFTASNKFWNFEALQHAGADGFIVKESPINSIDNNFTKKSLISFIDELRKSFKRVFLKDVFLNLFEIEKNLNHLDYIDDTDYHDFIKILIKQIEVIIETVKKVDLRAESTLDIAFLSCYNFLEQFKNEYYLKYLNNQYLLGIEETEMKRYSPIKNRVIDKGLFIPESLNDNPSWFNTLSAIAIDYFKICEINDKFIEELNMIKEERNNFIHSMKLHFVQSEIKMIINIIKVFSINMKE
jgi:CheY-like chemotaxis protein